jgi:hypothetical protein
MKNVNVLAVLACAGGCIGWAQAQTGLVNVSGASLLENYVKSNASTNDYIDADGNGVAGYLLTGIQQLAPSAATNTTQFMGVQYRVTGSVNGFIELTRFGSGRCASGNDQNTSGILGNRTGVVTGDATAAYFNRTLYVTSSNSTGLYNSANPGGAPQTADPATSRSRPYTAPGTSSGGSICIDVSPLDVSTLLATQKSGGSSAWNRKPTQAGYGTNAVVSGTRPFGTAGNGGLSNTLAGLNGRNLFNPANPGSADANTIFDTQLAFAPIAPVVNYGSGIQRVTMTQLQHLFTTGRAASGENFMVVTRDAGSGTRNAFCNAIGVDPSYGAGDNIGGFSSATNESLLGNEYIPTNKSASGTMEAALRNTRLAIGYVGTERGVTGSGSASWLTGNALEIADVMNDIYGGTSYVRPTITNIVNNGANGWLIGGQAVLATIGDPRANAASTGGQGWVGASDPFVDLNCNGVRDAGEPFTDLNGNGAYDVTNAEAGMAPRTTPAMANPFAAAYVNNITRSVANTTSVPSDPSNLGMPGEYAANQFLLMSALTNVHSESDYATMLPNSAKNTCVAAYTLANNVHTNAKYTSFNNAPAGKVPSRKTGSVYSDGVAGGSNYIRQGSVASPNVAVSYGGDLNVRSKIAGDFNGSGARDAGDVTEMVRAFAQRSGGARWNAPDGIYGAGAGEQAIIEVLGDFDGNGSFDRSDVRYFADGLFLVNGSLDRAAGFTAVDTAFGGNFFNTIIATGKAYEAGDSRGDVAGSTVGARKGYAPTGADGRVDGKDIDYVHAQFRSNARIVDGQANWSDLNEAVYFDLSADINGDLIVDQKDICVLVTQILGTTIGDVNLDGSRDATDLAIAIAYRGGNDRAGGWANGDVDGDGFVTTSDLSIIASGDCVCFCPADYNRDGGVDGGDVGAFFADWEAGSGCGDVNADGGIDGGDIEAFFQFWQQGGC